MGVGQVTRVLMNGFSVLVKETQGSYLVPSVKRGHNEESMT